MRMRRRGRDVGHNRVQHTIDRKSITARTVTMRILGWCVALSMGIPAAALGLGGPETKPTVIATFSIAAVDPETGQCGAAVASRFSAVGKVVAHARPGVGAYCTQHY